MNNNVTYYANITNIEPITSDTKLFVLKFHNLTIDYDPGQYIILEFEINNKPYRRSYSIVSFNNNDNTVSFIVKRIANGVISRHLFDDVNIGESIKIVGIHGLFTLPKDITEYKQYLFFAAGSGIAPILAIIKELLKYPSISINLLYSSKSASETIFYEEIINLMNKSDNFKVEYLFSETGPIGKNRLTNTLLASYLKNNITNAYNEVMCYTCGPLDYMDTVIITLLTEGIPKDNIRKELYYNYEIDTLATPDDTQLHYVTLHFNNGLSHKIPVQYPESILTTALKHKLPMPYSCGSGQCGSCTAKCTSGKVWMAYNEVLTDRELSQGYVLTCQGFPVDGDVTLEF